MVRIEIGQHLATDTRVCGGRLIFKGARILVSDVLELLQQGFTPEQISQDYKGLVSIEAIHEAVTFSSKGIVREVLPKAKTAA